MALLFVTCLAVSCTKYTYVEGMVPQLFIVPINTTIPIVNAKTVTFSLNIDGNACKINITTQRFKAIYGASTVYNYAANDSVIYATISSPIITFEVKNSSINKYSKGAVMSENAFFASDGLSFFEANKKTPYTGNYNTISQISTILLNFGINQDGYIHFKVNDSKYPSLNGWIHVIINEKTIVFDQCAYQTFDNIIAGAMQ
ncbi:hypothetical protein FO440_00120 [Mucilaginibacter corticis]|uniref:Uncharacterized protein n=1 Tax=Mucilaginibacter corticis TaxID=2597670 RepID=A0A556MS30_9SPHI|nr:hypothetical protein [Mucilaginibacter corticis]TSJ42632.1 hypothetical protein FO440_00120 [Mucilaginibacter corticis]